MSASSLELFFYGNVFFAASYPIQGSHNSDVSVYALTKVECSGAEARLTDCRSTRNNCFVGDGDAGVVCSGKGFQ